MKYLLSAFVLVSVWCFESVDAQAMARKITPLDVQEAAFPITTPDRDDLNPGEFLECKVVLVDGSEPRIPQSIQVKFNEVSGRPNDMLLQMWVDERVIDFPLLKTPQGWSTGPISPNSSHSQVTVVNGNSLADLIIEGIRSGQAARTQEPHRQYFLPSMKRVPGMIVDVYIFCDT